LIGRQLEFERYVYSLDRAVLASTGRSPEDAGRIDNRIPHSQIRRVLIDEEPALQIEELGNAESLLHNRNRLESKAQQLLRGDSTD
jgi:hypothetical protein